MTVKQIFYPNGKILQEESYNINGKFHNLNGPASRQWYFNGNLLHEIFYVNGERHNVDGPAYIKYYDDGKKKRVEYYLNGKRIPNNVW